MIFGVTGVTSPFRCLLPLLPLGCLVTVQGVTWALHGHS
jgi:hypothetical protein